MRFLHSFCPTCGSLSYLDTTNLSGYCDLHRRTVKLKRFRMMEANTHLGVYAYTPGLYRKGRRILGVWPTLPGKELTHA